MIVTRYHAETATRPARISARCHYGRVEIEYDPNRTVPDNHDRAAARAARKFSLPGRWYRICWYRVWPLHSATDSAYYARLNDLHYAFTQPETRL